MKQFFPIYNLLHQEIKACAEHLMETCQSQHFAFDNDSKHIMARIGELHQFSKKIKDAECYYPLSELKDYLENTMIPFTDEQKRIQSMRFSEAIEILHLFAEHQEGPSKSLLVNCIQHLIEEVRPGRPLFRKLREIKGI